MDVRGKIDYGLLFIVAHVRNHKCQDVVFMIRLNETTKQKYVCIMCV